MATVQLYMDGNMACSLLGDNLMDGDSAFIDPENAPLIHKDPKDKQKWAITQAHKALCEKHGRQLGYYHGSFFCDAYSPFHTE